MIQVVKTPEIKLPAGTFCGNCSDCVHYQERNTDSSGRGYCPHYGHNWPQERNGCFKYERR